MPVLLSTKFLESAHQAGAVPHIWEFVTHFHSNQAHPGIRLERVTGARSKDIWSGRVTQDLRAILHKNGDTWTLLYVDHHDAAYRWAERHEVGLHPVTGALQIVATDIRVEERVVERVTPVPQDPPLFSAHTDEYLVSLGLPPTWLPWARQVRREEDILQALDRLPEDVLERLLQLAEGKLVTPPLPLGADRPVWDDAETRRRFYLVEDAEELRTVLEQPLARWIAFLHPSQRHLATGSFKGPLKITGSAGTGKTVVALHRARHLARQGKRVLLTSFVGTLTDNLQKNLKILCRPEELERITVETVHSHALRLVRQVEPRLRPVPAEEIERRLERARPDDGFPLSFLLSEWQNVVCCQGIESWEDYRKARRVGRGRPLSVVERKALWEIFAAVRAGLEADNQVPFEGLAWRALRHLRAGRLKRSCDCIIVDEVQDLKPQEILLLAELAGPGPDALTLVGDAGQRIYPGGFSLRSLGVETRGRSYVLRLNYRTTEQIRRFADGILDEQVDDMDEGGESRRGTRSLRRGPCPQVKAFANRAAQSDFVVQEVRQSLAEGLTSEEIAVFARTGDLLDPLERALKQAGIPTHRLARKSEAAEGVQLGTMHRAKGLEFKKVFVVDVSANFLPHPAATENAGDPADQAEALENERRLLYVSLTRARDEVFVCYVGEPSPFLKQPS
ncbi:MAG TPA: 3'-5' exonuclease [Candidatus Nitrosotenuis sp.]|nr:3'-5' exonuclease [Candidatus Nitrosotenuis sp.]